MQEQNINIIFNNYLEENKANIILLRIMRDMEFCNHIIANNLYWKNINKIICKFGFDKTFIILKLLCNTDPYKKLINEEMYTIFEYDAFNQENYELIFNYITSKKIIAEQKLEKIMENCLKYKSKHINYKFINYLLNSKYKNIIFNNFTTLLNNCDYILELKNIIKDHKSLIEKYNNYINSNPKKIIYEIIIRGFNKDLKEVKEEKIFNTIKQIIDELLQNENLNYSDISFIGYGAFSYVVSIGTKVLKLGQKRQVFQMDNHRRFLKPLLRTEIKKMNSNDVLGCVEITEKVDTKNITEKDLYKLYKELRDEGYIWVDCRLSNVGRLIRKNKLYFENLKPDNKTVNYRTNNEEILSEGELVIFDNDYIFTEEEFCALPDKVKENYFMSIEYFEYKYYQESKKRSI